jgi:hypothetical protein
VKHPNFDLMHHISFFSRIMFDDFIAKRGEKKHDNVYLRGRACTDSVRGSLFQGEFNVL